MSRSYWRYIAAAVGLALLGASPPPRAENSSEQANTQAETRQRPPTVTPSISKAVEQVQRPILERPCRDGEDERQSDLCAQWKAANSASDAAWWAMIGIVVATIGTTGLYWQIYLTRRAVQDTGEATAAMRDANEIAETAARRNLRPFVYVKEMKIIHPQPGFEHPRISILVKNGGQSPAMTLVVTIGICFAGRNAAFRFLPYEDMLAGVGNTLPQGGEANPMRQFLYLTPEAQKPIRDGKRGMYIRASWEYWDFFDRRHHGATYGLIIGPAVDISMIAGLATDHSAYDPEPDVQAE
jgi:hypothetical protein